MFHKIFVGYKIATFHYIGLDAVNGYNRRRI